MKTAIVSGANGFIGNAVVKELIKNEIPVVALARKELDDSIACSSLVRFVHFDLNNIWELREVLKESDCDTFYHFAWSGITGKERARADLQLKNVQWTIECMRLAKAIGCKRFINAGSIMEKEAFRAASQQGNRPGMGYIYGGGKLAAHIMCECIAGEIGIDIIWGIITNAYGVGECSERLVSATIQKCLKKEVPQFTEGMQNYDFVYIDDVARAFRLIGEKGKPFHEYVIGSGNAKPLKEFLIEMKKSIAPELEFVFGAIPFTGADQPLEDFDCSQTKKDTGFQAEIDFADGCRRTIEWLKEVKEIKHEAEY